MIRFGLIYFIHGLVLIVLSLEITKQLFTLKTTKASYGSFIIWMLAIFLINDFYIEQNYNLEYKYIVMIIAYFIGYYKILKLNFISSVLVQITSVSINGIITNINIWILLLLRFKCYQEALEHNFIQYTSLLITIALFFYIIKLFDIKLIEVSKYK